MIAREMVSQLQENKFDRIQLMCNELSKYLTEQLGTKVDSTYEGDGSYDFYQSCSSDVQNQIYQNLLAYYSQVLDAVSKGVDPSDPTEALKHALEWYGYTTHDEVYKHFKENSVVELYELGFKQIWRSNNFFKYCGHSLAAVFCRPFLVNFKKDPVSVEAEVVSGIEKLLTSDINWFVNFVGDHLIYENGSRKKSGVKANFRYISKLYKNGSVAGLVAVHEIG